MGLANNNHKPHAPHAYFLALILIPPYIYHFRGNFFPS